MVDKKFIPRYLLGFVVKISSGHPHHLHIGRLSSPPPRGHKVSSVIQSLEFASQLKLSNGRYLEVIFLPLQGSFLNET